MAGTFAGPAALECPFQLAFQAYPLRLILEKTKKGAKAPFFITTDTDLILLFNVFPVFLFQEIGQRYKNEDQEQQSDITQSMASI